MVHLFQLLRNNCSRIPCGAVVHGQLDSDGPLFIDGTVYGDVCCKNSLHIGKTGLVTGNVEAKTIFLRGEVRGDVTVQREARIKEGGSISGHLNAMGSVAGPKKQDSPVQPDVTKAVLPEGPSSNWV